MRIVLKTALCLLLFAGLFAHPVAFANPGLFADEVCSKAVDCAHCSKDDSNHSMPMHGEASFPSDPCCPAPAVPQAAINVDCICSHIPGIPAVDMAASVPVSTTSQLVAIHVSVDTWDDSRDAYANMRVRPTRGDPLPPLGLFLRTMSFRI